MLSPKQLHISRSLRPQARLFVLQGGGGVSLCWCQGRSPDGVRHALTVSSAGMLIAFIAHGFILPKSLGTQLAFDVLWVVRLCPSL